MEHETRHVGIWIDRSADEVYDYVTDPANLPSWAAGLGAGVEQVDGRWYSTSPNGRVEVAFSQRNNLGVADHDVTLPTGEVFANPVRILPRDGGCEVDFAVRRAEGLSDGDYAADVAAVGADLATLKRILEG